MEVELKKMKQQLRSGERIYFVVEQFGLFMKSRINEDERNYTHYMYLDSSKEVLMEYSKEEDKAVQISSGHAKDILEELAKERTNAKKDAAKFLEM